MKELPNQYLNVGIAEQNGAGIAAGLATCGKIPFVVTYAVLVLFVCVNKFVKKFAIQNLNVKICMFSWWCYSSK